MNLRNLISIESLSLADWEELYALCQDIMAHPADYRDACRGRIMGSLFYEPSTRTNFSFQTAMMRLGGSVFGFSDPNATSCTKGETLMDTVRICSGYADVLVMRSPYEGAAMAASLFSAVPIINAGDGGHMHPTQTLADLTTICARRGSIGYINVGLCGDLKNGRTVHSLVQALSMFPKVNFYFISPRSLAMPEYSLQQLRERGQHYVEVTSLEATMPQLDILYMTRIQKERFADVREYERNKGVYILNKKKLAAARPDLLILHPLPRVDEIAYDVDSDPRAAYFDQARYGMFIRMALLLRLSALERKVPPAPDFDRPSLCSNPRCITQSEPYLPGLPGPESAHRCLYCDRSLG